jgi:menaquinone-specific isochorismate synthase
VSIRSKNGNFRHQTSGDIRDELRRRLDEAVPRGGIVSVRCVVPSVDPLLWIARQSASPRFFFSDRSRHEDLAAAGVLRSWRIDGRTSFDSIGELIDSAEDLLVDGRRIYGGTRFDPSVETEGEWSAFGSASFFLPRFEIRRAGDRAEFWLHADASCDEDVAEARRLIDAADFSVDGLLPDVLIEPSTRIDLPNYAEWQEAIGAILSEIRSGALEKAVLARAVTFASPGIDSFGLFDRVRANTPHCYHIFFEPAGGSAFLSATPERLFRRSGQRLISEAVAGTRPRGELAEDDARLRDELLASDKDRREHEVVGRSIVAGLEHLCSRVELDLNPTEMRLKGNRHLKSVVRATLRSESSTGDVFSALHPTPAVGGWPTGDSLELIDRLEPFDRGWYAGAIGWIGEEEAELTVGIRSALVDSESIRLYSGAGIVEGSVADAEWSEIEQKIDSFLNVIATPAACQQSTIRE